VDAFMCYKQKCKVVSLNLAHPVDRFEQLNHRHWHESVQLMIADSN